jgi:hypothetical protein
MADRWNGAGICKRRGALPWFAMLPILVFTAAAGGAEFVPKSPPTVKTPGLEINTENTVKNRTHKCETEGIADIRQLTSPFEEFWAFVAGKCTWIELGILEEIRGGIRIGRNGKCRPPSTVPGIKKQDVIDLIEETSELVLYHPHPTNASIVDHYLGGGGAGGRSAACIAEARRETLEAALPGIPDLSSLFQFARIFHQRLPAGRFAERIVSVYGVTEYAITKLGIKAMASGGFVSAARRDMRRYFRIRTGLGESAYRDGASPEINAQNISALLEKLNHRDGYFQITFLPFD